MFGRPSFKIVIKNLLKCVILIFFVLFLVILLSGRSVSNTIREPARNTPDPEVPHVIGEPGDRYIKALASDSLGNIYAIGIYYKTARNSDIFLLKYNTAGKLESAKTLGGDYPDVPIGITIDKNKNIYLTGITYSPALGSSAIFILKMSPAGKIIFQKTFGTPRECDEPGGIALDSSGNIYIGGETFIPGREEETLLIKCTGEGKFLFAKKWGNLKKDYAYNIKCDKKDNLYLTGATCEYGGSGDILLMKYNTSGKLLFARSWARQEYEEGFSIDFDGRDNIYVSGMGYRGICLLKFDPAGNLLFDKFWGKNNLYAKGNGIAVDPKGNIYIGGEFGRDKNTSSLVCLKFDPSGKLIYDKAWKTIPEKLSFAKAALFLRGKIFLGGGARSLRGKWSAVNGTAEDGSNTVRKPAFANKDFRLTESPLNFKIGELPPPKRGNIDYLLLELKD
ncbi:MAG: SBBP repeat-containing protein [Chloroflexi bacterium]|nr:SBBP repeat-containing protein [Chloroflexota bacterium]